MSKENMISFIAFWDGRNVKDVENGLNNLSEEQIKPLYEQMKEVQEDKVREMSVIPA